MHEGGREGGREREKGRGERERGKKGDGDLKTTTPGFLDSQLEIPRELWMIVKSCMIRERIEERESQR